MKVRLLTAAALIAIATVMHAQVRLETGGGEAHFDRLPSSALTSLSGMLDTRLGLAHLELSGIEQDHLAIGNAGAFHAALHATAAPGAWRIEAGPVIDGGRDIGSRFASTYAGDVGIERDIGPVTVGSNLRAGVAQIGAQHSAWQQPALHAGWQVGPFRLDAAWNAIVLRDSTLKANDVLIAGETRPDTLYNHDVRNIQEMSIRGSWGWRPLALNAAVGHRYGLRAIPETWWSAGGALHLTPMISLVAQTGRQESNVLLDLRGGVYTTLGLRLEMPHAHPVHDDADNGQRALILHDAPGLVRLSFLLPVGVQRAVLAGDLTNWEPIALEPGTDGRWSIHLADRPGTWRLNIRTDGADWQPPPGLPSRADEFGRRVGLLVLE
ncbi:MAG TPA: hypothetical protein VGM77_04695 [Gemmatimonadales bacterium]|jgi:hypothetical protein